MEIPRAKIYEACCTPDVYYPVLNGVHYNAEKHQLEAADGFILAVCPCPPPLDGEEKGQDGLIPIEAVKKAQQLAMVHMPPYLEVGENTVTLENGWTMPTLKTELVFPDLDEILPDQEKLHYLGRVDAKLLYRAARALVDDGTRNPKRLIVDLYQSDKTPAPIILKPSMNPQGGRGMIMPLTATAKQHSLPEMLLELETEGPITLSRESADDGVVQWVEWQGKKYAGSSLSQAVRAAYEGLQAEGGKGKEATREQWRIDRK